MEALVLSRALLAAEDLARHGARDAAMLLETARAVLGEEPALRLDYLALVEPDTLEPVAFLEPGRPALLVEPGWVGVPRRIGNTLLSPG